MHERNLISMKPSKITKSSLTSSAVRTQHRPTAHQTRGRAGGKHGPADVGLACSLTDRLASLECR